MMEQCFRFLISYLKFLTCGGLYLRGIKQWRYWDNGERIIRVSYGLVDIMMEVVARLNGMSDCISYIEGVALLLYLLDINQYKTKETKETLQYKH